MHSRIVDVTDRELTQFLKKFIKGMNSYYSLVHRFSKFIVAIFYLHFFEDRNNKYLCL